MTTKRDLSSTIDLIFHMDNNIYAYYCYIICIYWYTGVTNKLKDVLYNLYVQSMYILYICVCLLCTKSYLPNSN